MMKLVNIEEYSHLLNDLRNINEIFRRDVTYDNIKSHKRAGPHHLSEKYLFEKTTGEGQIKGFLGLITKAFFQSI